MSSPKRVIGVLMFLGYYFWIFGWRAWQAGSGSRSLEKLPNDIPKINFPPIEVIDSVVFAFFLIPSVFLMMGILAYASGFKSADVDVLFPTPVSPKKVMLYKLLRDYALTLITPLLILILSFRPSQVAWTTFFKSMPNPEWSGQVFRFGTISFLLMSVAWVCLGYGLSLYFSRPDPKIEVQRKVFVALLVLTIFAIVALITLHAANAETWQEWVVFGKSWALRSVFFLANGATAITVGVLAGNGLAIFLGAAGLLGITAGGLALALSQVSWMYDQAAMRADINASTKEAQRRGDMMAVMKEQAKQGKIKAKSNWISRQTVRGPWALAWKEALISFRALSYGFWGLLILCVLLIAPVIVGAHFLIERAATEARYLRAIQLSGHIVMLMLCTFIFTISGATSFTGFVEQLRRIDLGKPLPFSSQVSVLFEVIGKAMSGVAFSVFFGLVVLFAKPVLWSSAFAAIGIGVTFAILMTSVSFLVTVLFPDTDDPTQRGFRSLMWMLGTLLFCGLQVGIYFGLSLLKVTPLLIALPVSVVNVVLAMVATGLAGNIYRDFNPSE